MPEPLVQAFPPFTQRIVPAKHYHLIGIGGTAMGSLAGLLKSAGQTVTGSDEHVYPPMSDQLAVLGIPYHDGYDPANLDPAPDVVVVGNAISRGNPELETALNRRLYYTSAAVVVKELFLRGKRSLAVAGTHGKTTTASLLAWLLEAAGMNPGFLIGGVVENFGASFRRTDSDLFVIEADEYDTAYFDKGPKMWHYLPHIAVVTNLEFDHADIFRDDIAYRFVFERFVNQIPGNGTLVAGWDCPAVRTLAAGSFAPVQSVSFDAPAGEPTTDGHPRWQVRDVVFGAETTRFTVLEGGAVWGTVETPLPGAFNVRNALAAIAAAASVGAERDGIIQGLRSFRSVRRRMEVRGEIGGVTVIDDFAHHPTAVRETLAATRQRYPGRRVVAVFEPRSFTTQRRASQTAYQEAFGHADMVILAGLFRPERYKPGEALDPGALVTGWREEGRDAHHISDPDRIVEHLRTHLRGGEVVMIMSNGGFGGIHEKLLGALGERVGRLHPAARSRVESPS